MKLLGHGQINLWRGGSLWIGLVKSSADFHAHHAIQLSIGLKGAVRFRSPTATQWTDYEAALVPPHVRHAFDAEGSVVANILCEPESVIGRKGQEPHLARIIENGRRERAAEIGIDARPFSVRRPSREANYALTDAARDCAPLFTVFNTASSLNSLVSLRTAAVVETMAAFWAVPGAPLWAWPLGRKLPAQRLSRVKRARAPLIFFDIIGLSLL